MTQFKILGYKATVTYEGNVKPYTYKAAASSYKPVKTKYKPVKSYKTVAKASAKKDSAKEVYYKPAPKSKPVPKTKSVPKVEERKDTAKPGEFYYKPVENHPEPKVYYKPVTTAVPPEVYYKPVDV